MEDGLHPPASVVGTGAGGGAAAGAALTFDDMLDVFQDLFQQGIGPAGHLLDAVDHPSAVKEGPHGLGLDVRQAEGGLAAQLLLDVGNDLEQFGVGFQEQFEIVVLDREAGHQFLARGAFAGPEDVENRQFA